MRRAARSDRARPAARAVIGTIAKLRAEAPLSAVAEAAAAR
jgi:hypothetical protein